MWQRVLVLLCTITCPCIVSGYWIVCSCLVTSCASAQFSRCLFHHACLNRTADRIHPVRSEKPAVWDPSLGFCWLYALLASVWSWPSLGSLWRRRLETKQTPQGKVLISTGSANDWCLAMPESEIGGSSLLSTLFGKLYICSAGFRVEWSEVNISFGF